MRIYPVFRDRTAIPVCTIAKSRTRTTCLLMLLKYTEFHAFAYLLFSLNYMYIYAIPQNLAGHCESLDLGTQFLCWCTIPYKVQSV